MTNAVEDAIAAAKAQASQAAPEGQEVVQAHPSTGGAVASYTTPAAPMSLDDLDTVAPATAVDHYISPDFQGLQIGSKKSLVKDGIKVKIDTSQIVLFECLRFGNPATYFKTYDRGATCRETGGSWADAIEQARAVDPKVRPYIGADIPMTLVDDLPSLKDEKELVAKAGEVIGRSTTYTELDGLKKFNKSIKEAGLDGQEVIAELSNVPRASNGNNWGTIKLVLIGPAE